MQPSPRIARQFLRTLCIEGLKKPLEPERLTANLSEFAKIPIGCADLYCRKNQLIPAITQSPPRERQDSHGGIRLQKGHDGSGDCRRTFQDVRKVDKRGQTELEYKKKDAIKITVGLHPTLMLFRALTALVDWT